MPGVRDRSAHLPGLCTRCPFIPAAHDPAHHLRIARKHEQDRLLPSEQSRLIPSPVVSLQQVRLLHGQFIRTYVVLAECPFRVVEREQTHDPVQLFDRLKGQHAQLHPRVAYAAGPAIMQSAQAQGRIRLPG